MKKVVRLTESELVKLVKKVISEQNTPVKLKKGDIVTIVKKSDTSSKPVESLALIKVVYDTGNGQQRIGYKISGGNESQTDFDPKKMEFQDYKITKVNGMGLGELSSKGEIDSPPKSKVVNLPTVKISERKPDLIPVVDKKNRLIMQIDYNNFELERTGSGPKNEYGMSSPLGRVKTKNEKGQTVYLDFACGDYTQLPDSRMSPPNFHRIYTDKETLFYGQTRILQDGWVGSFCGVG